MKFKLVLFLVVIFSFTGNSQNDKNSKHIIELLERESATWRAKDSQGHSDCWYIQPYSRILVSTPKGETIDVPPLAMISTKPEAMGNGGFAVNYNYKIKINGKTAWVSHDEESTAADGKKTYSHEIRLLEKIKKKWKLTGQSIHIYKME